MSADVETMFSGEGHVPWWVGLGIEGEATLVEGLLNAAEAIEAAKLDWKVDLAPAFAFIDDEMIEVEDKRHTYRTSDNKVLGTVGTRYQPVQNAELFSFLDAIVDSDDAHYTTAGSLKGGKIAWVLLKVNKEQVRIGDGLDTEDYIIATTTHDGSGAVIVKPVRTLVVCWNTYSWALREKASTFTARHTASVTGKVAEAREALDLSVAWFDEFDAEIEKLLDVEVTNDKFHGIVNGMFPLIEDGEEVKGRARTIREGAQDFIFDVYSHEANAEFRGTGWGAVQAVNGYEQWGQTAKGSRSERQALKMLQGSSGFPLTEQVRGELLVAA